MSNSRMLLAYAFIIFSNIALRTICAGGSLFWHPYNINKTTDPSCDKIERSKTGTESFYSSEPLFPDEFAQWNLWSNKVMSSYDAGHGESMFGLRQVMAAIWKNQNPPDCSTAKYLISTGFNSGFGSEFHVESTGLAVAMNMGRVYIQNPKRQHTLNHWQFENDFCLDQGKPGMECYFQPWSNCTHFDAIAGLDGKSKTILTYNIREIWESGRLEFPERTLRLTLTADLAVRDIIPNEFTKLLECSVFARDKLRYWWRAAAVAFFLRPNAATAALISQHRTDASQRFDQEQELCISVYVRRGDKHKEMRIIEDETEFFEAARLIWDHLIAEGATTDEEEMRMTEWSETVRSDTGSAGKDAAGAAGAAVTAGATSAGTEERGGASTAEVLSSDRSSNKIRQSPIMYLGTEDPDVLDSALAWGKRNGWRVLYTSLFDRRSVDTWRNATEQQRLKNHHAFVHHPLEYFSMVLNLDAHIRCSGFVCTEKSNFCRVIDELRATVAGKANREYYTLNPCAANKGETPPCVKSTMQVDWR